MHVWYNSVIEILPWKIAPFPPIALAYADEEMAGFHVKLMLSGCTTHMRHTCTHTSARRKRGNPCATITSITNSTNGTLKMLLSVRASVMHFHFRLVSNAWSVSMLPCSSPTLYDTFLTTCSVPFSSPTQFHFHSLEFHIPPTTQFHIYHLLNSTFATCSIQCSSLTQFNVRHQLRSMCVTYSVLTYVRHLLSSIFVTYSVSCSSPTQFSPMFPSICGRSM